MAQTSTSLAGFDTTQLKEELARRKRTHPDTTGITATRPHKRSRNEPIYKAQVRSLAAAATIRPADIDDAEVPDEQTLLESIDWDDFVKRNPISYLDDARSTASWDSSVTFGRDDGVGDGEGDESLHRDDARSAMSWQEEESEFDGFGEDETGFDGFGDEDTGFNGFGDDDTSEIHDPITAEEVELVDLTETQGEKNIRLSVTTRASANPSFENNVQSEELKTPSYKQSCIGLRVCSR